MEVLNTRSVAEELVLVASTVSVRLAASYSARCTETVSAAGGGAAGATDRNAERLSPPSAAVITTVHDDDTGWVPTVNVALVWPAGTVIDGGSVATAGWLLLRVTVAPPAGAGGDGDSAGGGAAAGDIRGIDPDAHENRLVGRARDRDGAAGGIRSHAIRVDGLHPPEVGAVREGRRRRIDGCLGDVPRYRSGGGQ